MNFIKGVHYVPHVATSKTNKTEIKGNFWSHWSTNCVWGHLPHLINPFLSAMPSVHNWSLQDLANLNLVFALLSSSLCCFIQLKPFVISAKLINMIKLYSLAYCRKEYTYSKVNYERGLLHENSWQLTKHIIASTRLTFYVSRLNWWQECFFFKLLCRNA